MALKEYKPITPGLRGRIDLRKDEITAQKPEKSLTSGAKNRAGRDSRGRISVRGQGGGQMVRSAGAGALVAAKEGEYVTIKLPSGETRLVNKKCYATIGEVGNEDHMNTSLGKAGRSRWLGIRPTVRGMAMNPIDHPLGGGEGRGKGRHPVTPWGQPCKGYKTRKKRNPSDRFIVSRRKKK